MSTYELTTVLALVIVSGGIFLTAWREKMNLRKISVTLLVSGLGALLGARLLQLATGPGITVERLFEPDIHSFALFGGLVGGGSVGLAMVHFLQLQKAKMANISAFWTGLGIATMRIGCFIEGCCYGKDTNMPWGVHPPLFKHAHWEQLQKGTATILSTQRIHPTQLYELAAALFASAVVAYLYLIRNQQKTYIPFVVWICTFAGLRLVIHFFREMPDSYGGPSWLYPVLYVTIIFLTIVFFRLQKSSFLPLIQVKL